MNAQKIPLFGREQKPRYEQSIRLQSPLNPIENGPDSNSITQSDWADIDRFRREEDLNELLAQEEYFERLRDRDDRDYEGEE